MWKVNSLCDNICDKILNQTFAIHQLRGKENMSWSKCGIYNKFVKYHNEYYLRPSSVFSICSWNKILKHFSRTETAYGINKSICSTMESQTSHRHKILHDLNWIKIQRITCLIDYLVFPSYRQLLDHIMTGLELQRHGANQNLIIMGFEYKRQLS